MNRTLKLGTLLGSLVLSVACATVQKEVNDLSLEERVRVKTTVTETGAVRTDFSNVQGVPIKTEIQGKGIIGDYTFRVTYDNKGYPKEKVMDSIGITPALIITTYVTDDQGNILEEKDLDDRKPRDGIPERIEVITYKPGCKKDVIDRQSGADCITERSLSGVLSDTGEVIMGSIDTYGPIRKNGRAHIVNTDYIDEGRLKPRRDGESRNPDVLYTKEFSFFENLQ